MMMVRQGMVSDDNFDTGINTLLTVQQGNKLWNMYLDVVKEDDKQIAKAWKGGSDGILIFVSPYRPY